MDYRALYERLYLGAFELLGQDVTVKIAKVEGATLVSEGNKKSKKPVLSFDGKDKKLALCKTNSKTIAAMYGNDTEQWIGRYITIFPTTTHFGKDVVECIRIRPTVPQRKAPTQ